jgi:hypothetical protein
MPEEDSQVDDDRVPSASYSPLNPERRFMKRLS